MTRHRPPARQGRLPGFSDGCGGIDRGSEKNDTSRIVLHSFSHLAETKAPPEFARELLDRAEARLQAAGYDVWQTPFGYFLDLDLAAPGRSAARIFASF